MKVFSVWYDSTDIFTERGYTIAETPQDADVIILNGGEDIATEFYGEKPVTSYGPHLKSRRDIVEERAAQFAMAEGKLIFAICRGAQLMNVLNGGKLWQHVNNHGRDHNLIDLETGRVLRTTSVHHQMMIPTPDAEIIAVSSEATTKHRQGENVTVNTTKDLAEGQDPEVLWYPATRSLCIQGHPEYGYKPFTDYCFEVLDRLLEREASAALSKLAV